MKIAYCIVPLTLSISILTGCTSLTPPASQIANPVAAPKAEVEAPLQATLPPYKEKLPDVTLTEEIFFKIITAEVAFQRGDFPAAFATTIAVAQQTHDPRSEERRVGKEC